MWVIEIVDNIIEICPFFNNFEYMDIQLKSQKQGVCVYIIFFRSMVSITYVRV